MNGGGLGSGLGPADVLLRVDDGPSVELDEVLARYEAKDPVEWPAAHELARWARERAAASGFRAGT